MNPLSHRWTALGLVLCAACGSDAMESTRTTTFDEPVDLVLADVESGRLTVVGADVATIQLIETLRWTDAEPSVDTEVVANVLKIEAMCPDLDDDKEICEVHMALQVPYDIALDLRTEAGDIEVERILGDVDASTGGGEVQLKQIDGSVEVDTDAGDVALEELTGLLDVRTADGEIYGSGLNTSIARLQSGSGEIKLTFDQTVGELEAGTSSGEIELLVPSGSYRLGLVTGSGDVRVDGVDHSDNAQDSITATTGAGDITVWGR